MSKNEKYPMAKAETAEPSKTTGAAAEQSAASPTKKPTRAVHGPGKRSARSMHGVDRLRNALGVSDEVTIEQLCEEAAVEIEQQGYAQPLKPSQRIVP